MKLLVKSVIIIASVILLVFVSPLVGAFPF